MSGLLWRTVNQSPLLRCDRIVEDECYYSRPWDVKQLTEAITVTACNMTAECSASLALSRSVFCILWRPPLCWYRQRCVYPTSFSDTGGALVLTELIQISDGRFLGRFFFFNPEQFIPGEKAWNDTWVGSNFFLCVCIYIYLHSCAPTHARPEWRTII